VAGFFLFRDASEAILAIVFQCRVVFFAIFFAGTCHGDTIKFGSAEAITGHLVSVHQGVIHFQSDHLGLLTFSASPDMTISVDGVITLTTDTGKDVIGMMKPNSGPLWTMLIDGGVEEASISPKNIAAYRATPEAAFSHRGIAATDTRENPWEGVSTKPGITGPWSIDSKFAFTGVQATRDRRLIDWTGEVNRVTGTRKFSVTSERIYSISRNTITQKSFVDDDVTQGEAQYTQQATTRTSVYLDFQGLSDQINFIDHQLIAAGGVRYKLWRESNFKATAFAGPSWLDSVFLPNEGVTTPGENFGAIQVGYTVEWDLPANTTLHHDLSFNQSYESGHPYEGLGKLRIRHMVNSWLFVDASVVDDYNAIAAYQAKQNRLRYSGGLGVKFSGF
jgi:Protein of unknown function, DUF481